MDEKKPTIVIIGAGFAGLNALKELESIKADLILIDKNNFHTFYPLLYQVSAAELTAEQIGYPLRSFLRDKDHVNFIMGEVTNLNVKDRIITINEDQRISFDFAIIGVGSSPHFFGIEGAAEFCYTIDSLAHAELLRNQILTCFERASKSKDQQEKEKMLKFTIIGAGPTGVEYASTLSELIYGPLEKDFPNIDMESVSITVIEALDQVIPALRSDKLSEYTERRLEDLGVNVKKNSKVKKINQSIIELSDGEIIPSETVIWTAGVRAPEYLNDWGILLRQNGQIEVDEYLRVKNASNVYAVGDVAYFEDNQGNNLPLLAPVAIQQGKYVGNHIKSILKNKNLKPFSYDNKGSLVVLGRYSAVAQLWDHEFSGFFAWVLWGIIHIAQLIGFRNKLVVMINWFWDFLFFEKVEKLIM